MIKTTFVKTCLLAITLVISSGALANSPINTFAGCLVDNLNGKERKLLAKWIYFAMAAHPEIKNFSNVSKEQVENSHREVGGLITRLLVEDCPKELKAAYDFDPQAIERGFEFVGQVAMQELMTNDSVSQSLVGHVKYTDEQKIQHILTK